MKKASEIIKKRSLKKYNVNVDNKTNKYVNVSQLTTKQIIYELTQRAELKADKHKAIAEILMNLVNDTNDNIKFYLKIAREHNHQKLLECAHIAKVAKKEGQVRTSTPKYFVGILKRKGFLK